MRLFDSERALTANGLPMYPFDRPRWAVPELMLRFFQREVGTVVEVSAMLAVDFNSFRWFQVELPDINILPELLEDWLEDPEGVMTYMGWKHIVVKPAQRRVLDSLEIEL